MASLNGKLATSNLTQIPAKYYTHAAATYLRSDAAASFLRVAALYEQKFGKPIRGISFYRTYQRQVEIFQERYTRTSNTRRIRKTDRRFNGAWWKLRAGYAVSASPGYSNHGLGQAMDLTDGIQTRGTAQHEWWAGIAKSHGWTIRYDIGEPWHAEYDPSGDKYRGTKPVSAGASKPAVSKPAASKPAASVSATVKDLAATQQALADLGYYAGKIDGVAGTATTAAVKAFQNDAGITADGSAGPDTRKTLEDFMSKIDDLYAVAVENQKRITRVLDAVENGKAGVRSDGTLVSLLKSQHKETLGIIAPGAKGVRTDGSLVEVIKAEARANKGQ